MWSFVEYEIRLIWISSHGFSLHVCVLVVPTESFPDRSGFELYPQIGVCFYRTSWWEAARVGILTSSCHDGEYFATRREVFVSLTSWGSCFSSAFTLSLIPPSFSDLVWVSAISLCAASHALAFPVVSREFSGLCPEPWATLVLYTQGVGMGLNESSVPRSDSLSTSQERIISTTEVWANFFFNCWFFIRLPKKE